jgi:hypothetical protein
MISFTLPIQGNLLGYRWHRLLLWAFLQIAT